MRIEITATTDLSMQLRAELAARAQREFDQFEIVRAHVWAEPTWVLLGFEGDQLVTSLGIVDRHATADDRPVHLFGLNNVITEPQARGRGYSVALNREALAFMARQDSAGLGLLFCDDGLVDFYARLGWQRFAGRVTIAQPSGDRTWTSNCMVNGLGRTPPAADHVHLCGPPW